MHTVKLLHQRDCEIAELRQQLRAGANGSQEASSETASREGGLLSKMVSEVSQSGSERSARSRIVELQADLSDRDEWRALATEQEKFLKDQIRHASAAAVFFGPTRRCFVVLL